MEIKQDFVYKGTRILFGSKGASKRKILNKFTAHLEEAGFQEMFIPIIQFQETFKDKVGDNKNLMFNFLDRGDRQLCLAPEYTALCQKLASTEFKFRKDVKLFYIGECFRGEKPQKGRYRQFTQFGVEVLNPSKDYTDSLIMLSKQLLNFVTTEYIVNLNVSRGHDYYVDGKGFDIEIKTLGSQSQVCGGGSYDKGIGFAIGIDRLLEI